ncbi:MAG: hypothetical protein WCP39_01050 [Chlamydiota bacterium]
MPTPVSNQYFPATAWANKGWGSINEPLTKEVREPKWNLRLLSFYKPAKQVENPNGGFHLGRLITTFLKSVTLTPFAIAIDIICDIFKVTIVLLIKLMGKLSGCETKSITDAIFGKAPDLTGLPWGDRLLIRMAQRQQDRADLDRATLAQIKKLCN